MNFYNQNGFVLIKGDYVKSNVPTYVYLHIYYYYD